MDNGKGRLTGKVAIVTGAGSRGPGVGTGKAASTLFAREGASVLLVDATPERAEETRASIEGEGGTASVLQADVYARRRLRPHRRASGWALRQTGHPVQQCGHRQPRHRARCAGRRLRPRNGDERAKHGIHKQVRRAAHGRDWQRLHHQHIIDSWHTSGQQRREHPLCNIQGRRHRAHNTDVRASWAGWRACQLHRSRSALHADGRGQALRRRPRPASAQHAARHRGQRMGHRMGSALPCQRRSALDNRRNPASRWRRPRHHTPINARTFDELTGCTG